MAVVGSWSANTALGLLHDQSENELCGNIGLLAAFDDGGFDSVDLVLIVVVSAKLGTRYF